MSDDEILSVRIRTETESLDRINGWINNADTRVGGLLAFDLASLAFLGTQAGQIREAVEQAGVSAEAGLALTPLGLYGASLIVALYLSFRVLHPDIQPREQSLLFFGSIAKMRLADFKAKVKARTPKEMEDDLLEQVHTNSTIAQAKFASLRAAVLWSLCALVWWAVTIALAFAL